MANFANSAAGRVAAETWAKAKIVDKTWVNAHVAIDKSGNTICRFQRYMAPTSATTKQYGAWTESRDDAAT